MQTKQYSIKTISKELLNDIGASLQNLEYGSLEIYVVEGQVTQISKRQITKTKTIDRQKKQ